MEHSNTSKTSGRDTSKEQEINDFKFEYNFHKIGHKKMLLNARRIYRGDIGTNLILLAMENVQ